MMQTGIGGTNEHMYVSMFFIQYKLFSISVKFSKIFQRSTAELICFCFYSDNSNLCRLVRK